MRTVLLARHGETHWNREGRVQGWAPTALTERGREQAAALGAWLSDSREIHRVVTSDLRRTRETTERARAAATGLPEPSVDHAWRERGFGVYQGFLAETLFERHPDHDPEESVSSLDADPEGGESVETFRERVESAWAEFRPTVDAGETTLLVTHGGVVKVLLASVTERSLEETITAHSPPNCSVTEIRLGDGETELLVEGATPWRE